MKEDHEQTTRTYQVSSSTSEHLQHAKSFTKRSREHWKTQNVLVWKFEGICLRVIGARRQGQFCRGPSAQPAAHERTRDRVAWSGAELLGCRSVETLSWRMRFSML